MKRYPHILCATLASQAFSHHLHAEALFADEPAEEPAYEFLLDVDVRQDAVRNLPRPVEADFDRTLLRARLGVLWSTDQFEIGLTGKINQNSDDNDDSRRNLDNEAADDETIDDAFIKYHYSDNGTITVGQAALPLRLNPVLWDSDLRPRGVTLSHQFSVSEYSELGVTLGSYQVNHVFDDEAELNALQLDFRAARGLPVSYSARLSYLAFDELDDLIGNGIARTNSRNQGQLAEDFDLVDLNLGLGFNSLPKPLRIGVNLTRNLQATESDAARLDVVYGISRGQPGWEFGFAAQRVQQDAVVAAFNDDDWWFPTNVRGVSAWVGYGFTESLRLRVAGFTERRDDLEDDNRRYLVNLEWSI